MLFKGFRLHCTVSLQFRFYFFISTYSASLWRRLHANVVVCMSLQCDMQKLTVEELKRLLYDTFCDHLSMKDIENIIMTEENHIENPEDCQVDIDSKEETLLHFLSHIYMSAREDLQAPAVSSSATLIKAEKC